MIHFQILCNIRHLNAPLNDFSGVFGIFGNRGDISIVCAFIFFTGSGSSAVASSTRTRSRASLLSLTRDYYPSSGLLHTPSLTLPASRVFLYARIPRLECWKEQPGLQISLLLALGL